MLWPLRIAISGLASTPGGGRLRIAYLLAARRRCGGSTARLRSCDEDRLADYDRSILSTPQRPDGYFGVPLDYPPLKELAPFLATKPRHVMLLLLDGMGGYPLKTVLPETSYLRAHDGRHRLHHLPATTAAATTAYYCGQSALESGWLGWHST